MTNCDSEKKTTIKIQCPPQFATRLTTSAKRLGVSRNDYLLSLIGQPPLALNKEPSK